MEASYAKGYRGRGARLIALSALLLLPALPPAGAAAELYAQAIGQPPEREPVPAPASPPEETTTAKAPPVAPPPEETNLRTRIAIGAAIALALAALGGNGGGGTEGTPAHAP